MIIHLVRGKLFIFVHIEVKQIFINKCDLNEDRLCVADICTTCKLAVHFVWILRFFQPLFDILLMLNLYFNVSIFCIFLFG